MAKGARAQIRREWCASHGLELTYIYEYTSKVLVLLWYMISQSCLYFRSEWVRILWHGTEDTAIYVRVFVVYANSDSSRNKTYGSALRWLWTAAQQYSIDTKCYNQMQCLYELHTVCCGFCCARAGYALIQKSTIVTIVFVSLYIQTQKKNASFLLVPHIQ